MKRITTVLFCLISAGLFTACDDEVPQNEAPQQVFAAKADLVDYFSGNTDTPTYGQATFTQNSEGVVSLTIEVDYAELGGRTMGVHIHEGGLENPGMHFNADLGMEKACSEVSLGESWNKPYIGDVGNLVTNDEGVGSLTVSTDLWNLNDTEAANNILNRTLIIHFGESFFTMECDPNHVPDHSHPNAKFVAGLITASE